ncbi:MAG: hypothetical protein KC561_08725 [Myxococcales bacterium]|nr:hypothetical protein [Myxococcales bacterium]
MKRVVPNLLMCLCASLLVGCPEDSNPAGPGSDLQNQDIEADQASDSTEEIRSDATADTTSDAVQADAVADSNDAGADDLGAEDSGADGQQLSDTGLGGEDTASPDMTSDMTGDTTADATTADTTGDAGESEDLATDSGADGGTAQSDAGGDVSLGADLDVFVSTACPTAPQDRCKTPIPSPEEGQQVVIRALEWGGDHDTVVLQAFGESSVTLSGWVFCSRPNYETLPTFTLEPGNSNTVVVHLNEDAPESAPEGHIYLGSDSSINLSDVGELGLFNAFSFEAGNVEAFVRWGDEPRGMPSRIGAAAESGFWEDSDAFVAVCDEAEGIVSIGDVANPDLWHSQPADVVACTSGFE